MVPLDWMGTHLDLIGADPCVDGGHLCGCRHTGRRHGSLQAQPGVDDILVFFSYYFFVFFSSSKYAAGVEGETGSERFDNGDEYLLTRQQPSPDNQEK